MNKIGMYSDFQNCKPFLLTAISLEVCGIMGNNTQKTAKTYLNASISVSNEYLNSIGIHLQLTKFYAEDKIRRQKLTEVGNVPEIHNIQSIQRLSMHISDHPLCIFLLDPKDTRMCVFPHNGVR